MSSSPSVSRKLYLFGMILTLGLFLHRQSFASEEIILKIVVNTVSKGEFFVILTPDQDVQVKAKDFTRLGIKDLGRYVSIEGEQYVSLKSLRPDVSFELNEKLLTVQIKANPALLGETALNLYSERPESALAERNSAFFNYAGSYSTGERLGDLGTFTLSTEIGTRFMGFLTLGTFNYIRSPTEEKYIRLNNSIIKDDLTNLRRFILGDSVGSSGPLGSSILMGGISVGKEFSIVPHFIRHPLPSLQGIVATPSEIEISQRGFVVQKERLPPGIFVLQDIPGSASGLGQLDFLIRDAFGREERISKPYYIDPTILKQGVHDYAYSFGLKREAFGAESFQYSDPVFLAFHNVGFSDNFNGGLSAEASKDLINFGPTTALLLGNFGLINLAGAYSNSKGTSGGAGLFTHSFVSKRYSTRFSLRAFSPNYTSVSNSELEDKQKIDASFGVGVGLDAWGSIVGEFSFGKTQSGLQTRKFSLSYSRQMTKNTSLFVTSNIVRGDEISDRLFAGLHVNLGGNVSGSLSHTTADDEHRETFKLQRSLPASEGFGYRLSVNRVMPNKEKGFTEGDTFLQYNSRYNIYTAEYQRSGVTESGNFSLSGGIAAIGGSLHLSRPINDGFALVRVPKLKGVGVKFNNKKSGETNSKGELLIPNILSFQENKIEINNKDVPLNYRMDTVTANATPPFRGGAVVEFKVEKLQAIIGAVWHTLKGGKTPIEYGGLRLWVLDAVVESPIGKEGEFYLENVPPGKYRGSVSSKTGECEVQVVIPESDEPMIDLGNLDCERHRKAASRTDRDKLVPVNIFSAENKNAETNKKDPLRNGKGMIEAAAIQQNIPPFGNKVGVEFKPKKLHEVVGTISYTVKGIKKSVAFKSLRLKLADKVIESPLGRDGELYLEKIPSGKHHGTASSETGKCSVNLVIPDGDHPVIDLRSITCEELS